MQRPNSIAQLAIHASLATTAPGRPVTPSGSHGASVVCEGWVLKKRRKRMQGFARRYFTLLTTGLLSYSMEPGQPARDQVFVSQAAISTAPGRRDIHVDSNTATFHIKCLSVDDFNMWMGAFRKFIAQDFPTARRSSMTRTTARGPGHYNRTHALVDEMGLTISELDSALTTYSEGEKERRRASTKSKVDKREHLKEHTGNSMLGLFKKSHSQEPPPAADTRAAESGEAVAALVKRLQSAVEALRHQHAALSKTMHAYPSLDTVGQAGMASPLPVTAEEDEGAPGTPTTPGTVRKRASIFSSHSEGSEWFDAPEYDGPEEFIIDNADEGQEDKMTHSMYPTEESSANTGETDSEDEHEVEATLEEEQPAAVVRRTQLPSGPVGDEGSLFAVLKKNVGKDLSKVALPVTFNEPLTMLQKAAEELEYSDILSEAAKADNSVDRICFVAAFAVSTYANTKHRTGRKGFNPMLTETFEDVRMKFIAEKVCHNPVIMAYHAEGDGWELYATSSGKTKFWGKSMEIIPQGTTHLKLGNDHFEWCRPSSFMRNLMMGTKYLEHCGKMTIKNVTTGESCTLEFKEGGYWGPSNVVVGTVASSAGKTVASLEGKWDEQMAQKLDSSHLRVLWRMAPFPKNALEYYGFTAFGITLNEITPDLQGRLPPTDSRLRADVRALENGDLDGAESEKHRIEEMQRQRRTAGKERAPRWFKQVGEEWVYTGGYWEQRARGWIDVEPLW